MQSIKPNTNMTQLSLVSFFPLNSRCQLPNNYKLDAWTILLQLSAHSSINCHERISENGKCFRLLSLQNQSEEEARNSGNW